MAKFKMASRSADEMQLAKQKLTEAFEVVKGPQGKLNRKGVQKLKEMEWDIAELVIQLMNDEILLTDPTPFMVDVSDQAYADNYVWQEPSAAFRVVDRAVGSKPLSTRMTFKEYGVRTFQKEVVAEVPLEQIASGRYNASDLSSALAEATNRYRIGFILDSIDAAVPSGADRSNKSGYTLRYTNLTEANLKNAVNGLMDEGMTPSIFGRHLALQAIQDFAGYTTNASDAALREFEQRGMVATYLGAPIVRLQDKFSKKFNSHVIRFDRVYLGSGEKGAVYVRKDVSFLDFVETDIAEGVFRVGTRIEDGLVMTDPYQYRIITVS